MRASVLHIKSSTFVRERLKNEVEVDHVTRRFNASSAGLKSSWGCTFAETTFYAISRSNWSPESAEVDALLMRLVRMVPGFLRGTGLQLMQFNNPLSTKEMKTKNMTTLHLRKSIGRSPLRLGFLFIPLALTWFALSPTGRAQDASETDANGNSAMEGSGALSSLTIGSDNTGLGVEALHNNTSGGANTATGQAALFSNTFGGGNTANGAEALLNNTTANDNTATGFEALLSNTTAGQNVAIGSGALQIQSFSNVGVAWSSSNVAVGYQALNSNQPTSTSNGINNTAVGTSALQANTTGADNTANGNNALSSNTTGNQNTATGELALANNTTGGLNTADGDGALFSNTTGFFNTATGPSALQSNTTGNENIALGFFAGGNLTTGSNNIDIFDPGVAGEANTIRIGTQGTQTKAFVAGVSGVALKGAPVEVNSSGQLGVKPSSARFKEAIKPMDKASEAILALKPVTFRYKKDIDPDGIPEFGLVAEDVEKVNPNLVARDAKGKIYTVRYEAVNAMLLNEFLKEHRKVEEQETAITRLNSTVAKQEVTIAQQQKGMEVLAATLKEQASQIQKVSAQVELSKTATQMAVNNQ